jgi:hypothetical protein
MQDSSVQSVSFAFVVTNRTLILLFSPVSLCALLLLGCLCALLLLGCLLLLLSMLPQL